MAAEIQARAVPRALQRPASEQRVDLVGARNAGFDAGQRHEKSVGERGRLRKELNPSGGFTG